MYQGHHSDGSGVQKHSAGPLYPYVIGVRERQREDGTFNRSWFVLGPKCSGFECPTHEEAVAHAEFLLGRRSVLADNISSQWKAYEASRNTVR